MVRFTEGTADAFIFKLNMTLYFHGDWLFIYLLLICVQSTVSSCGFTFIYLLYFTLCMDWIIFIIHVSGTGGFSWTIITVIYFGRITEVGQIL